MEYAAAEYWRHLEEHGYEVVPANLVPAYRGEDKGQMIRKMPSQFSWDWGIVKHAKNISFFLHKIGLIALLTLAGPSYPNSGIWYEVAVFVIDYLYIYWPTWKIF